MYFHLVDNQVLSTQGQPDGGVILMSPPYRGCADHLEERGSREQRAPADAQGLGIKKIPFGYMPILTLNIW